VKIRFVAPANEEFLEVIRYYKAADPATAAKFLPRVKRGFRLIERFPELCPRYKGVYQKFRPGGFPHAIFYAVESEEIVVYAVLNLRQDPARIHSRLGVEES